MRRKRKCRCPIGSIAAAHQHSAAAIASRASRHFRMARDLDEAPRHSRRPAGLRPTQETLPCPGATLCRIRSGPALPLPARLRLSAQPVAAGECPAGKIKPNAQQMVDYKPVGVTDVTLGAIDLGKQPAHIEGRELRFRKLTIEPGGIVPWHSHDDRPALDLRAAGRDRRIRLQLRRPDRAQGRRHPPRGRTAPRIGGRTSARRPSFSMSATSARIPTTTTCNERDSSPSRTVTGCGARDPMPGATSSQDNRAMTDLSAPINRAAMTMDGALAGPGAALARDRAHRIPDRRRSLRDAGDPARR